jgi:hypothetical protein
MNPKRDFSRPSDEGQEVKRMGLQQEGCEMFGRQPAESTTECLMCDFGQERRDKTISKQGDKAITTEPRLESGSWRDERATYLENLKKMAKLGCYADPGPECEEYDADNRYPADIAAADELIKHSLSRHTAQKLLGYFGEAFTANIRAEVYPADSFFHMIDEFIDQEQLELIIGSNMMHDFRHYFESLAENAEFGDGNMIQSIIDLAFDEWAAWLRELQKK